MQILLPNLVLLRQITQRNLHCLSMEFKRLQQANSYKHTLNKIQKPLISSFSKNSPNQLSYPLGSSLSSSSAPWLSSIKAWQNMYFHHLTINHPVTCRLLLSAVGGNVLSSLRFYTIIIRHNRLAHLTEG